MHGFSMHISMHMSKGPEHPKHLYLKYLKK